jgi:hypothetical protein
MTGRRGRPKGLPKPPGSGRRKGTPNKVTKAHKEALAKLRYDSKDPMSFFISVMRNPDAPFDTVMAAARELMPYSHPKLAASRSARAA